MLTRRPVILLAAVFVGELACNAKSPTTPATTPSPTVLKTVIGSCPYQLETSALPATIPASGNTYIVELTTDPGCSWTAQGSFLPIGFVETVPAQGNGSKSIAITVHPQTGTQDRKLDVTIATMTMNRVQSAGAVPVKREHVALNRAKARFNQADHDQHAEHLRQHKSDLARAAPLAVAPSFGRGVLELSKRAQIARCVEIAA